MTYAYLVIKSCMHPPDTSLMYVLNSNNSYTSHTTNDHHNNTFSMYF